VEKDMVASYKLTKEVSLCNVEFLSLSSNAKEFLAKLDCEPEIINFKSQEAGNSIDSSVKDPEHQSHQVNPSEPSQK
jgi:hypothetical protein